MDTGLTFEDARKKVIDSFQHIINDNKEMMYHKSSIWLLFYKLDTLMKLNVTPVLVIILYAITLAASSPMSIMYSGTITTIVCITIVMILNAVIITLYHESERIEVSISLEKILNEYQNLLIDSQHGIHGKTSGSNATVSPNQSSTENNGINSDNNIYLTSGHSQVSIVHTFRQVYKMY